MCDKKNSILFIDTECVVLSPDVKLLEESQVLLKVPRNHNMYSFDLKNVVPVGGLTCLFANVTLDDFNLWHRRLGHINFKTMNRLVRGNLVRGNQTNGNASTKENINVGQARKKTDPAKQGDKNDQEKDLKDQEKALRKQFEQESARLFSQGETANTNNTNKLNIVSSPVNAVSSSFTTVDPGRERAQRNEFESMFGQDKDANGNRMFTPICVSGSTYVNLGGSIPNNVATLPNADLPTDPLMPDLEDTADLQDTKIFCGAYDDEVEGTVADFNNLETHHSCKHAIGTKRVYRNKKDKREIVVRNKARLVAQGYIQQEGIDYDKVFALVARIEAIMLFLAYASFMEFIVYQMDVKSAFMYGTIEEEVYVCQPPGFEDPYFPDKVYKVEKALYGLHQDPRACQYKYVADILKKSNFSLVKTASILIKTKKTLLKDKEDPTKQGDKNDQEKDLKDQEKALRKQFEQESARLFSQGETANTNSTNKLNIVSSPVNAVSSSFTTVDPGRERAQRNEFESMFRQDKDANGNRMFTPICVSRSTYVNLGGSIPNNVATLPNADLPTDPLMPDLEDTADLQDTKIFGGAYDDEVEGKHAIGTKRVYRNKKDKREIVVRNKARLVSQGYIQEEGIDYDKVFALVARIEAITLFLAYASFMEFIVYQMDVKSAFMYGTIEEEVYVCQPPGFEDPYFPNKVYKVEKALYSLHQAPRAWINAQEVPDEFYRGAHFLLRVAGHAER
nr:copia protein [Tanacetum cinerariifolium]